jgi:Helix-turn-helix domain
MSKNTDEKMISVQIEQEFDVTKQDWEHRVYIKLFVALRTSGLLKALGDKHFRSLVALALYMNKDGKCHPSLEELAATLGVSKTSASTRYKELCAFRWNGQPIVSRIDVRDPKTKERIGTEYTILVDSIKIFDEPKNTPNENLEQGQTPETVPSSSFLEVGQYAEDTPSSSFLEVGETPETAPSSRKPKLGQAEPNYIELNTEYKDEGRDEHHTEQRPADKKKNVQITFDDIANLDLDSKFLPEDFPPKFTNAVKEIKDDMETILYYFNIAKAAHKDAEKILREQLQDPTFEFGGTYFDDELAAKAFSSTIGRAKLGKIERTIEDHFRGNVRRRLVRKELDRMGIKQDQPKQPQGFTRAAAGYYNLQK